MQQALKNEGLQLVFRYEISDRGYFPVTQLEGQMVRWRVPFME